MALTQIQIIQSLGEAMSWFERELGWGVPATELRHLTGRIGELYAALITNGQMATNVNEKGYDVVGESGERVSVKTTGMLGSSGHISFNPNTLDVVDRVIILRINTEEMQIETLLNDTRENAEKLMTATNASGKRSIALSKMVAGKVYRSDIAVVASAVFDGYTVKSLENGTILVFKGNEPVVPARPSLGKMAAQLGVSVVNSNGNPYNTRQLGSLVIAAVNGA